MPHKYEIEKLIPYHVQEIKLRESDVFSRFIFQDLFCMQPSQYIGWAVIIDGSIACICAGVRWWNGVGQFILAFSDGIMTNANNPITRWFCKKAIEWPSTIMEEMRLHRLETSIEIGFLERCKWAEKYGFKYEGTMKKYGPDQKDWHRYAIVR